jgi:pilus assembly protein CpaB
MNLKRLSIAFVVALAVSALCTWALSRKMGSHAAAKVVDLSYVAAAKPLQAGEVIKQESLEMVSWPADKPVPGAMMKPQDAIGRLMLYPMSKDQPLTDMLMSAPGSGMGLSAKIPDGMRAIALHSDEVMGVAGFIFPGSHIDVVVTCRVENAPEAATFTVLQDAEVLAVGQRAQPDPDGKPATATVVTLLLSPVDAERAVMASSQGTFHFVLRSGSDKEKVTDSPVRLSQLATGANFRAMRPIYSPPSTPVGTPVSPAGVQAEPAAEAHLRGGIYGRKIVVETVSGEKVTTDTFSGGR